MEKFKKLYYFFVVVLWAFALIGGTSYLIYYGIPQFAVANIALAAMAFPYVKETFKKLIN